jgi:hypothetical protein
VFGQFIHGSQGSFSHTGSQQIVRFAPNNMREKKLDAGGCEHPEIQKVQCRSFGLGMGFFEDKLPRHFP